MSSTYSLRQRIWARNAYAANPEKYRARARAYGARNKEKVSARNAAAYRRRKEEFGLARQANPQLHRSRNARYKCSNPSKYKQIQQAYTRNNRATINEKTRRYQAAKIHATPPWLTTTHISMMRDVYRKALHLTSTTGIPHHVDHIYPLQGKTCCGLHVPWNLQILTREENSRKHNKIPEMPFKSII